MSHFATIQSLPTIHAFQGEPNILEETDLRHKVQDYYIAPTYQTQPIDYHEDCSAFEGNPEGLAECHKRLAQHIQEVAQLEQRIAKHKQIEQELRQSEAELIKVNQELEYLVMIDALTQVANRRCFDDTLHREWQRSLREQQPLSLILLDIDYFKGYNDLYGHPAGDYCLTNLAQAVKQSLQRSTDLIARYGGEEFAIILPNTTAEGAIIVTELIQKTICDLATVHENSEVSNIVTTSLGIATIVPIETQNPSILIEQTDQALYKAKQQGRNRYFVYI